MVKSIGVFSGGSVVVMATVRVTTLHPQEMGKPDLPLPQEVMSSSSADSSRMVCRAVDPL
jgi:hypothetical protein